jgi:hypothetical protein
MVFVLGAVEVQFSKTDQRGGRWWRRHRWCRCCHAAIACILLKQQAISKVSSSCLPSSVTRVEVRLHEFMIRCCCSLLPLSFGFGAADSLNQ